MRAWWALPNCTHPSLHGLGRSVPSEGPASVSKPSIFQCSGPPVQTSFRRGLLEVAGPGAAPCPTAQRT